MTSETHATFESVKERLDEIVDAVADEGISLDDALDLYEEAVKLGMQASTMLEEGIANQDAESVQPEGGEEVAAVEGEPSDERGQEALGEAEASAEQAEQAQDAGSQLR